MRQVVQPDLRMEAFAQVFTVFPELRTKVHVDDIDIHVRWQCFDVFGTLKKEIAQVKLEVSLTSAGNGRAA